MKEQTILDILPQMKTGVGFFSSFSAPVWAEEFTNTTGLDMFFAMTYGHKHPAPFLTMFVDETTGKISNEDLDAIASIIYDMRKNEWSHLFDALMAEYNPIENTEVNEEVRENRAINASNGNIRTLNTQTSNSGSGSVTSSGSGSGSNAHNVFGYDSSTAVGDSTDSNSSTSQSSTTTTTGNTINDTGSITDAGNNSSSDSFQRIYTKHGNIGTQTAADLIGGVLSLYQWTFIIQIMEDISKLISLSVY